MKPKDPEKVVAIYRATLRLVGQNGLTGLTMAAIGKEAGIGMGTLYTYFESKEALINALFKSIKGGHTQRIFAEMDVNAPYPMLVRRVLLNYLKNLIEYHEEHSFLDQALASHFLDDEARALGEAAYGALFALLDQGKEALLVKPLPNPLLAANLVGAANEIANLVIAGTSKLDQEFVDQAFTLCWDGIKR